MRSVRSAICTSGEPVSVSCRRCSAIVADFSGIWGERPRRCSRDGRAKPRPPRPGSDRDGVPAGTRTLAGPIRGRPRPGPAGDRRPAGDVQVGPGSGRRPVGDEPERGAGRGHVVGHLARPAPRWSRSAARRAGGPRTTPGPPRRRGRRRSPGGTPRAAGASAGRGRSGAAPATRPRRGPTRRAARTSRRRSPRRAWPRPRGPPRWPSGSRARHRPGRRRGPPTPRTWWGRPSSAGGRRHVAGGEQLADARGRHHLRATRPPPRARPTTSNPCRAPISVSSATLPARRWPKWKSSPTTTRRAPSAPTSTSSDELLGRLVGPRLVEGHHQGAVDAGRRQELELLVAVGEDRRRRLRAAPRWPGGGRRSPRRWPAGARRPGAGARRAGGGGRGGRRRRRRWSPPSPRRAVCSARDRRRPPRRRGYPCPSSSPWAPGQPLRRASPTVIRPASTHAATMRSVPVAS